MAYRTCLICIPNWSGLNCDFGFFAGSCSICFCIFSAPFQRSDCICFYVTFCWSERLSLPCIFHLHCTYHSHLTHAFLCTYLILFHKSSFGLPSKCNNKRASLKYSYAALTVFPVVSLAAHWKLSLPHFICVAHIIHIWHKALVCCSVFSTRFSFIRVPFPQNAITWHRYTYLQAGARSGCSISASRKCKPPWWKGLFVAAPTDYEERERCEEREMAACLEAAKEACIKFAKAKCIGPFRDARIASDGLLENTDFALWSTAADKTIAPSSNAVNNQHSFSPVPGVTNYRGSDVLDSLSSKENDSSGWRQSKALQWLRHRDGIWNQIE